jgi:amino acid adenylation domain-containing protein/non-ribosomal peptide synthase protein (TIGR01720 family)
MTYTAQPEDRELVDLLLAEAGIEQLSAPTIRRDTQNPVPLSRAQRRLWFIQQVAPASPAYNIFCAVRLTGRLNVAALEASLNEVVRRHESLRTSFPDRDGRPTVLVFSGASLDIPIEDLSGLEAGARGEKVTCRTEEEARSPFDLGSAPLIRVRLLRLGELEHVAVLTMHHIISDGWSMNIFLNEFSQLYEGFSRGQPTQLPELTLQYGDFARWEQDWLASAPAAGQRRWWKEHLTGLTPLELPTDRPRPAEPSHRGAVHLFRLPKALVSALKRLGQQEEATLFVTLLAAFSVLLHRYTGQVHIAIGSPIANRHHPEIETLIGYFVNTLVMRCDLSGRPSFLEVLERVRDFAYGAFERQGFPFDELVKELAPPRNAASNPIVQVMFSSDSIRADSWQLPELTVTPVDVQIRLAKFDLLLSMSELPDGLLGAFEYSTDLFDAETIRRMASHFTMLLEAIATDKDTRVATLPMLGADERRQLLKTWNDTGAAYPREDCVARSFGRQARQTPDAIALEFSGRLLTYAELNVRSNQVAHRLISMGVGPGTRVAVFLERSVEMIVGVLGILKAGGAYVPLDLSYPEQRLRFMLDDCGAAVLVTQDHLRPRLSDQNVRVLWLDPDCAIVVGESGENPDLRCSGDQLAYVIYTSGSTGIPKGVAVPHQAVTRLVRDPNFIQLDPTDRVAQASNASFDAATFEIWGALLNGARLVGIDGSVVLSPPRFAACLRNQGITTLFLTTALFNQMARDEPAAFQPLRNLLFGGEAVDPQPVRRVLQHGPPRRLLHVYGPTENTTFSTWHLVQEVPEATNRVPIGLPVSGTQAYVVDRNLALVPVGVPGEVYLGGAGLAHGYHCRPDLTAERFIPNPFDECPGSRLYKTGDLARRLADGSIEYLGRRDDQVKIRGFRVELGEIESVLLQHPSVCETVLTTHGDETGRLQLVAYIVAAENHQLIRAELRDYLRTRLPPFMVPAHFIQMERMPLTVNGKVDKSALPALPADQTEVEHVGRAPRDERERTLTGALEVILRRNAISIDDDYFELGGDSITAIQVVSRVRRAGWNLTVHDLFRNPTVAGLAPHLTRAERAKAPGLLTGVVPLTPIQKWFFANYEGDLHHFNQALLTSCADHVSEAALRSVLRRVQHHHDMLRATYRKIGTAFEQIIAGDDLPVSLEVLDLSESADYAQLMAVAIEKVQRGFNLATGPLMRAVLFRLRESDRLLVVIHHLVVDGVSWRILLEDFRRGYRQCLQGEEIDFGPKTHSYKDWADHLLAISESRTVLDERAYWLSVDDREVPELPRDFAVSQPNLHGECQTVSFQLSAANTQRLLTRSHRAHHTEINDLILTAFGLALKAWHGNAATLITLEGHGREPLHADIDLSRTVGWFTCLYPFRLALPHEDLGSQIEHVSRSLRSVPHKGLSFGVLSHLTPAGSHPELTALGRCRIAFNYLGRFDEENGDPFLAAPESCGQTVGARLTRVHDLDVSGIVAGGRLSVSTLFHPQRHKRETIVALMTAFERNLLDIVGHCTGGEEGGIDGNYTCSRIPADDYDRILRNL